MNKTEILQILDREFRRSRKIHWLQVKGKFNRLTGEQLENALIGINRYIRACQSFGLYLEPNTFIEICEDVSKGQQIWLLVNDDRAILSNQRVKI